MMVTRFERDELNAAYGAPADTRRVLATCAAGLWVVVLLAALAGGVVEENRGGASAANAPRVASGR